MSLFIRKAQPTDAEEMAMIHARSWEVAYAGIIPEEAIRKQNAKRSAMWQMFLSGEHHHYIALSGETAVGLLSIQPSRDEDQPLAGEIVAIYLHPDFFSKGYGGELMTFALQTLKEHGFQQAILWVLEENARARRFYEKHGFTFDGTKKEVVIGKDLIEIRYRKEITN